MSVHVWLSFASFTLAWSLVPGPSVGFTIAYAIRHGLPRAAWTIVGQLIANAAQILVVSIGLSQLLVRSATAFVVLKAIGVAYLLFLGVRQWRASPEVGDAGGSARTPSDTAWSDLGKGFVICAANPKALLYFAAILPQFLSPGADRLAQFALLGATNVIIGGVVLALYALLSEKARIWLAPRDKARMRNRVAGGLMIAAAAYLALGKRS